MPGMMFSGPDVSRTVSQELFFKSIISRAVFSGTLVSNDFKSVPGGILRNQEFKKAFRTRNLVIVISEPINEKMMIQEASELKK